MEKSLSRVVLTGGSCGGKTTSTDILKQSLEEKGYNVIVVSEVATELILKGYTPERLGREKFQQIVFKWQMEKEKICTEELQKQEGHSIIICDRGLIDGKTFSGEKLFGKIIKDNNLTEEEIYKRYDLVLHFTSTAVDAKDKYVDNNPARKEGIREAAECDRMLLENWRKHPNVKVLDNSTSFEKKVERAVDEIVKYIELNRNDEIPI